jgi:hypothetical protein
MTISGVLLLLALLVASVAPARADVSLLLEEPFGRFGYVNPTGHMAIYLPRVCAQSPVQLRRCELGEAGVVISRYRRVAGYDWLAIPLIPYLYAVDTPGEVPASVTRKSVAVLRDTYRRNHFLDLIPDGADGEMPPGDWTQLVGAAYDRKIYGFEIETSEGQDDQLIQEFNRRPNHAHFNLFIHNCADFSRNLINFYFPKAVHRNFLADAGITTPKQVAKSLVTYSRRHPELQFSSFAIPQVPGNLRRSHGVHGVAESIVRSKEYVVPLLVLHPYITGTIAVAYLWRGRFHPARDVAVLDSPFELQPQLAAAHPRSPGSQPTPPQKAAGATLDAKGTADSFSKHSGEDASTHLPREGDYQGGL